MDLVLGMSMAPATIRMVLVEDENADGVAVEEDDFEVATADDPATSRATEQVIAAILGTREGAVEAGCQLSSIGVAWTDQVEAAALRDALATYKIENVMLLSAFFAAAALTQTVGHSIGYGRTAMLLVEPETATLAVVDSADGSITDVRRRSIDGHSADVAAELVGMVAGLEALETKPDGLFVVGCGVGIAPITPQLEAATPLTVSAPEEPKMALARGAALAAANAPLFALSTAALAYARDPGTGQLDAYGLAGGYVAVPEAPGGAGPGDDDLAYSAVPDEEADACTAVLGKGDDADADLNEPQRRPVLLAGTALAVVFVVAVIALEIALAIGIRPTVALQPNPGQALIVPTKQAPVPAPAQGAAPRAIQTVPQVQPRSAGAVVSPPALHAPAPAPAAPAGPPPAPPVPARPVAPLPLLAPLPLVAPGAPAHLPAPQPLIHVPAPQARVHVAAPQPPLHMPVPPAHVPAPESPPAHQWVPRAPVHVTAPRAPVHQPAPQAPPVHMRPPESPPAHQWVPQAPVHATAPQPPQLRMPVPAPERPAAPAIPPPGPQLPQLFAPRGPGPAPLSPGGGGGIGGGGPFGGHGFGGGGPFGGHGFGGGGPFGGHGLGGFGGFGGGHGFGGFGGFGR